ncbi:hypothetical protein TVAG_234480 [Trichomonas vaginalis G3]|uniref:Uncharacterized protein n=1 Tax=Trichomonas vaginalis (strain ATCC PRA-98 / G3) TaxID=412133 RepID=A2FPQ4_TRIV3|nr:hypothetical protein TVAGG3_0067940 [Trichomonas vaginalis G3]EAX93130.1 hypothetical protein TVAG_234480 [Trichomonas vaginalis G3]KAI5542283.1 hypothetical protein TVAGG3_0067940 [Trichomonas vaginalis G3]|eukprot:XP_001306060.1 hypothetical protein [Trichomonas vaginalis G3]
MTSKLSPSEKQSIILNEAKGIQHPLYYVCHMKNGSVQVRKRKAPLNSPAPAPAPVVQEAPKVDEKKEEEQAYTNKMLLEMMTKILERNSVVNEPNMDPIEREKETKENQEYVQSMEEKRIHFDDEPEPEPEPPKPQPQVRRIIPRIRRL